MRKGFTLVELLISISIMGILTVIVLAVYTGVSANARDTVRKNDLKTLATALEVYYQANNKYILPETGEESCTRDTSTFYDPTNGIAPFISGNIVPVDPKDHSQYCYISINNGASYRLFAKLENCTVSQNSLCDSTTFKYSLVSEDLTVQPAPAEASLSTIPSAESSSLPSSTPTPNSPPTLTSCTVSSSPATANAFNSYSFVNNAADPDGTIASYTINWGDTNSNTYTLNPASPNPVLHSYTSVGSYLTKLQVTDNRGTQSSIIDCGTVTVNSPSLFTNLAVTPQSGHSPLSVTLSASGEGTAGGYITFSYWWNCADTGSDVSAAENTCGALPTRPAQFSCSSPNAYGYRCYVTDPGPTHSYSAPDTYKAKVIIERGGFSATDSKTVTVSP